MTMTFCPAFLFFPSSLSLFFFFFFFSQSACWPLFTESPWPTTTITNYGYYENISLAASVCVCMCVLYVHVYFTRGLRSRPCVAPAIFVFLLATKNRIDLTRLLLPSGVGGGGGGGENFIRLELRLRYESSCVWFLKNHFRVSSDDG